MAELVITQLGKNPYALGIAARFIAHFQPFAGMDFGPTINALVFQINEGTHLIASQSDEMVGYLGWLRVDAGVAEAWQNGTGKLAADPQGGAIAVTILATTDPATILPMIKVAKNVEPGKPVYWKRYFTDGRPPHPRRVLKAAP